MEWRALFDQNVLNAAEKYIRSGSIQNLTVDEKRLTARVSGIENFNVEIRLAENTVSSMKCTCS